jgi:superfamily II DNA or RNA helicase
MNRTATKRQRLLLWKMSDGVCAMCGAALDESFNADHRIPWSVAHATNVHDMQALCGPCNKRKGWEMLRAHQETFDELCRRIAGGDEIKEIIAAVTPGGGKSLLPIIAAHRLISSGRADRICWVTPRLALGVQGERAFMAKNIRGLLGHSLEIRASTNEINPSRDMCGFVTTYQAIAQDPELHAQEFARRRYILVLDEPHHIEAGGVWHRALRPIYDLAVLRVMMSGSLERSDGQRIAFLPYCSGPAGQTRLDLTETDARKVVRYSLKEALAAHAVVPMYFELVDGNAEWLDRRAQNRQIESLADAGADTPAALYTALASDYAKHLLSKAVDHWIDHRAACNARAKLLVVAASIPHAREYQSHLRDLGVEAALATSADSNEALNNIERMKGHKKPPVDVLVTVAMAYEGLDVKSITHVACLTHIRARPWIEQMLARATRFDDTAGAWHDQAAHIFAPDDELFRECIAEIRLAQDPILKEQEELRANTRDSDSKADFVPILPIASSATSTRASGFVEGDVIDAAEHRMLNQAAREAGIRGQTTFALRRFVEAVTKVRQETTPSAEPPIVDVNIDDQTPSQREDRWKRKIQNFINERCGERCAGYPGLVDQKELQARIQEMSGQIIRMFGKSRTVMSPEQLEMVWNARAVWSGFLNEARRAPPD